MTTTVHIAVSGSKQVKVTTQGGVTRMQPGAYHAFTVHGDGVVNVQEIGDFVSSPSLPLVRPYMPETPEEGATTN